MKARITTFDDFYRYYLSEHSVPLCRRLHFVGTGGFFGMALYCLVDRPLWFGGALLASVAVGYVGFRLESRRSAAPTLLLIIALCVGAHPGILGGVAFAYGFAWIGHFIIEKNRPATFTYPLWSLLGDFRMWGEMLRGRRWSDEVPSLP